MKRASHLDHIRSDESERTEEAGIPGAGGARCRTVGCSLCGYLFAKREPIHNPERWIGRKALAQAQSLVLSRLGKPRHAISFITVTPVPAVPVGWSAIRTEHCCRPSGSALEPGRARLTAIHASTVEPLRFRSPFKVYWRSRGGDSVYA